MITSANVVAVVLSPSVIISDQGREFANKLTDELFQKTKTQQRITSAYHPQVNSKLDLSYLFYIDKWLNRKV